MEHALLIRADKKNEKGILELMQDNIELSREVAGSTTTSSPLLLQNDTATEASPVATWEKTRALSVGTVKKRKTEMEKLHKLELRLRARLKLLKLESEKRERDALVGDESSDSNQAVLLLEKKKAQEEAARGLLVMQDNIKLRRSVLRQLRTAKALRRLLQRRMRQKPMKCAAEFYGQHQLVARADADIRVQSNPIFDLLVAALDEMYAGVDSLFEGVKIDELPCPGRENLALHGTYQRFVEFLDVYEVPFGVRQTENAVWDCLKQPEEGPFVIASSYFDMARNALLTKWVNIFYDRDRVIVIKNWRVSRKYVEEGRTVIVCRGCVEPNTLPSVVFHEKIRLVVKAKGSTDLGPTSVIQSHREATRHYRDNQQKILTDMDEIGVAAWNASVTRFNHNVEDALIRNNGVTTESAC